jgi:hypothetical protein
MSPSMYSVKLKLSLTQKMCPICFRALPFEWGSMTRVGDGHHVLVRRGAFEDELLWATENIVLLHHSCHMSEGQATIHECAMLLDRFGGPEVIDLWHRSLPWKEPRTYPAAWHTATRYFGKESYAVCPRCGERRVHDLTTGAPARESGVCWHCFNLTSS